MNRFVLATILALQALCISGAEEPPASDAPISPEPGLKTYVEATTRAKDNQFGVYIPASYKAGTPMPLLFDAHEIKRMAEWQKHADDIGFIVLGATFVSNRGGSLEVFHTELLDDEKMLLKIMQRVFDALSIDRKHVLFTGCSAGAFPTWFIAAKHPDIFTALCFRSGNFPGELEDINSYIPKWKSMPIYMYWGEKDRPHVFKQNEEAVKFLEEKIKLENFKHEIIPNGGHTSRADIASKWFESLLRGTPLAPAK